MRSLYVFVNSDRPDQYLNSLAFCVLRRDVRRVVFLHISGLADTSGTTQVADGLSGRILGSVQAQLEALAERAEYSFRSGPRSGEHIRLRDVCTEDETIAAQRYYKNCRELPISYSNEELDYGALRTRLRAIAIERDAFVDVTAISKRYLGDVVAAGLVEGLVGLYTFNLVSQEDFQNPWRTLIHALERSPERAFEYTNILDTQVYRECAKTVLVRRPRLVWSLGATAVFFALGGALIALGSSSELTQGVAILSSIASVLSLVFVFVPPRTSD